MTTGPPAVKDVAIGVARPKAAILCSQNIAICLWKILTNCHDRCLYTTQNLMRSMPIWRRKINRPKSTEQLMTIYYSRSKTTTHWTGYGKDPCSEVLQGSEDLMRFQWKFAYSCHFLCISQLLKVLGGLVRWLVDIFDWARLSLGRHCFRGDFWEINGSLESSNTHSSLILAIDSCKAGLK